MPKRRWSPAPVWAVGMALWLAWLPLSAVAGAANSTNGTTHDDHTGHHDDSEKPYVLYTGALLCVTLVISVLIKFVNTIKGFDLPFSLSVFVAGGVLNLLAQYAVDESDCEYLHGHDHDYYTLGWCGTRTAARVDPHLLLLVLLPPLIYESASKMDWYVFKRGFDSIFVLAFPGVIFSFWLIAVIFQSLPVVSTEWPFAQALTLGAILAATDPVAVVSALHELGAPPALSTVIDGESLMNDGSAMVMFLIFSAKGFEGEDLTVTEGIAQFFQLSLGGVAVGAAFFLVLHVWLSYCAHNLWIDSTFAVCLAVFGCFFCSEILFGVSGVLAVVTLGLGMGWYGKYSIQPSAVERLDTVMEWLAAVAEAAIFFFAGVVSQGALGDTLSISGGKVLGNVVFLYFIIHLVRGISIMLGSVVFMRPGKDRYVMEPKELLVVWFGGLRGAVGLALALEVFLDDAKDADEAKVRQELLVYVSGIVCLTLFINGTFVVPFYNGLNLYPELEEKRRARQSIIRHSLASMELQTKHEWKHFMGRDWLYAEVMSKPLDMEKLRHLVPELTHVVVRANGALSFDSHHRTENVTRFVIKTLLPLAQARNTVLHVRYRMPHQHDPDSPSHRLSPPSQSLVRDSPTSSPRRLNIDKQTSLDSMDRAVKTTVVLTEGITDRKHSNLVTVPPLIAGPKARLEDGRTAATTAEQESKTDDGHQPIVREESGEGDGAATTTVTSTATNGDAQASAAQQQNGAGHGHRHSTDKGHLTLHSIADVRHEVQHTLHLLMEMHKASKLHAGRRRHRQASSKRNAKLHSLSLHAESYCNTVFNALAALYKEQFEQHELTEHALVHLDSARHKAISFFEDEIKNTNHGKESRYGGKDQPTVLEIALDVELQQLLAEIPDPLDRFGRCISVLNKPYLPLLQRLFLFRTFRRVYTYVETLCGFIRAHEMLLSYLSIVKDEQQEHKPQLQPGEPRPRLMRHVGSSVLGDAITDRVAKKINEVSAVAHEKLTEMEHRFPNAVYIVKMLLTAQAMCRQKMLQVQKLHTKGILAEADMEYLMRPLHHTLEHLHHVTDHPSMGTLVERSVGRIIVSDDSHANLVTFSRSGRIRPEFSSSDDPPS